MLFSYANTRHTPKQVSSRILLHIKFTMISQSYRIVTKFCELTTKFLYMMTTLFITSEMNNKHLIQLRCYHKFIKWNFKNLI